MDLGEVEKRWLRRLDLDVGALMGMPPFSALDDLKDGEEWAGEEEELLEKGFVGRRGIARFDN